MICKREYRDRRDDEEDYEQKWKNSFFLAHSVSRGWIWKLSCQFYLHLLKKKVSSEKVKKLHISSNLIWVYSPKRHRSVRQRHYKFLKEAVNSFPLRSWECDSKRSHTMISSCWYFNTELWCSFLRWTQKISWKNSSICKLGSMHVDDALSLNTKNKRAHKL